MEKRKKAEILWLVGVVVFYILYNMPFYPEYGDARGMMVHALLTLVPLWVIIYVGFFAMCRLFPIKDEDEEEVSDEKGSADK